MDLLRLAVAGLALAGLTACGGGAGGETEQFCDEAADRTEAFRGRDGDDVSPQLIGTLRELALEAPDELSGDFEAITEGSGGVEINRAVDNIEAFLVEECGLEIPA